MTTRLAALAIALCVLIAGVGVTTAAQGGGKNGKGSGANAKDAFKASAKLRKAVKAGDIIKVLERFQRIADQNGGNRAAGRPGYDRSAEYVAGTMEKLGYRVQVQEFEFEAWSEDAPTEFEQIAPDEVTYEDGADFSIAEYSGSGDVTAELVAVDLVLPPDDEPSSTSGCEAEDYEGLDVEGKIALVQRGTCTFGEKADIAADAGAAGVLIFNEGNANYPDRQDLLFPTLEAPRRDIPVLGLPFALGEELANGETNGPTGITVRIFAETSSEIVPTANVIATSKRGDANNIVMAGAHLDSVQAGPGINDNGSGSAALVEIAREISKLKKPKNRVRFAWWAAEEAGLVGSTYYVEQLSDQQAAKIALYTNYDMIGSPNFARFIYDGNGSAFGLEGPPGSGAIERAYQRYFERQGLASGQTAFDGRSDYLAFIQVGIPAGGLFTGAEGIKTEAQQVVYGGTDGEAYDPCYHQACDDIENISRRALEQMSDAAAHVTWKFMNNLKFVRDQTPAARAATRARTGVDRDRVGDAFVR
ncbi:MAG TPA: M28 family metallopeptidase [Solirubrobacterales bacterium]|jgi:Zn-dependent M28 family amino/carboxypeptidase